jgi:hypothetical protein
VASKYGKGYYNDWESMMFGIQVGLQKAFEEACQEICEKANEYIRGGIYGNLHSGTYDDFRTYEMADIEYLKANISGTHCWFTFNDKEFMSLTIDNPEHHALSDDRGNGYDVDGFMWDIINPNHNNFMDDVRDFIQKEFKDIYRKHCNANGLVLS